MIRIAGYLKDYYSGLNNKLFLFISLVLSLLIWFNYHFKLNDFLISAPLFITRFYRFYLLFAPLLAVTYLASFVIQGKALPRSYFFYLLLLISPAIFAVKVALKTGTVLDLGSLDLPWRDYYNIILQWPIKAIAVFILVYLIWKAGRYHGPLFGLTSTGFNARPYFIMIGLMMPLLLLAGTGTDFQLVYPKLKMIGFMEEANRDSWWTILIFEICYGLDFFTIELFFRGFMILAFIKYAGRDAILPMAVFYCAIHFGKPAAECVSSYFGGLILGVVVERTRSIWGGLIIHLGIAWIMEIAGIVL